MSNLKYDDLSQENKRNVDEIRNILESDTIDTTTAINILINAVNVSFDKDHFNDLDRTLISKALKSIELSIENGQDIVIKVK